MTGATTPLWESVDAFGTGYLLTRVLRHDSGGHLWIRSAGERRPAPFTPVPSGLRAVAEALPDTGLRLVLGVPADGGRLYSAPGPAAVGHRMLAARPDTDWGAVEELLTRTGRTLRALHTAAPAAGSARDAVPADTPAGAARLAAWLLAAPGPGPAGTLRRAVGQRLGALRVACLLDWCEDLAEPVSHAVALHGGVSVGSLVPGPEPAAGTGALLAGEELAHGPAAYDVGWLLGELAELRRHHLDHDAPQAAAHCAAAARGFLRGYGSVDPLTAGRAATLRVLTHAHDFAAYVGWAPQLPTLLDLTAGFVDTDGLAALPDHRTD